MEGKLYLVRAGLRFYKDAERLIKHGENDLVARLGSFRPILFYLLKVQNVRISVFWVAKFPTTNFLTF